MLSPHFSWAEVEYSAKARELGLPNTLPSTLRVNAQVLAHAVLEPLRYRYGLQVGHSTALRINSWYRSDAVNRAVGGSSTSDHRTARAADIEPVGRDRLGLWITLRKMAAEGFPVDQGIVYETTSHLHVGWRPEPRRQLLVKVARPGTHGAARGKSYVSWAAYTGPLKT